MRLRPWDVACHQRWHVLCNRQTHPCVPKMARRYNSESISLGPVLWDYTDIVLSPMAGEAIRFANLPLPPKDAVTRDERELHSWVSQRHNASLFTITNEPWYGVVACRDIAAGEPLAVHYGELAKLNTTVSWQRGRSLQRRSKHCCEMASPLMHTFGQQLLVLTLHLVLNKFDLSALQVPHLAT